MSFVCRFVLYLCGNKTKANEDMEKDLSIEEKCQKAIVVKPINWEQRIGKEKAQRDFAVSMALLNVKLRTTKSTTEN